MSTKESKIVEKSPNDERSSEKRMQTTDSSHSVVRQAESACSANDVKHDSRQYEVTSK